MNTYAPLILRSAWTSRAKGMLRAVSGLFQNGWMGLGAWGLFGNMNTSVVLYPFRSMNSRLNPEPLSVPFDELAPASGVRYVGNF